MAASAEALPNETAALRHTRGRGGSQLAPAAAQRDDMQPVLILSDGKGKFI